MTYALLISYDGTNYCGWQIQKNGDTVQAHIEQAVTLVFGQKVSVTASGRTDAGVHALGQVCHLRIDSSIPGERLADALNPHLPKDIRVVRSSVIDDSFDANRTAKRKTYCYSFYASNRGQPLWDRYSAQIKGTVSLDKLQECAKLFEGEHDFKAYCASGSSVKTTVRTIYQVEVVKQTNGYADQFRVYVTGNGFLYNMVRTLVGTMIAYAQGRLQEKDVHHSLIDGDRLSVGRTMPACGLTLMQVDYGFPLFGE